MPLNPGNSALDSNSRKVHPGDFSLNVPTEYYHGTQATIKKIKEEGLKPQSNRPEFEVGNPKRLRGVYLTPHESTAAEFGQSERSDLPPKIFKTVLPRKTRLRKDPEDTGDEHDAFHSGAVIHKGTISPDKLKRHKYSGW